MIEQFENKIINADCLDILKQLPDKCIDLVLTDPPYGYLNCKFDREYFDEQGVFIEIKRVLKDDGIIAFFGRGDTFYKWNLILEKFDFPFKEEIIWNKNACSSPFGVINRVHETISIRGKGKLNKIKIPTEEYYNQEDYIRLVQSINRFISSAKTKPDEFLRLIKENKLNREKLHISKFYITTSKNNKEADRGIKQCHSFINGFNMKSIVSCSRDSVYKNIHPTQKPVILFERLLKLCSNPNDLVLDCFSGSGTTAIACHNLKRRFICIEKDKDYYESSVKRLEEHQKQLTLF